MKIIYKKLLSWVPKNSCVFSSLVILADNMIYNERDGIAYTFDYGWAGVIGDTSPYTPESGDDLKKSIKRLSQVVFTVIRLCLKCVLVHVLKHV